MLPPGDIRACLLALANTEPTMEKLFQYRFDNGRLKGQSFGNLLIAAMNGIYGSFEMAIKETSNVLAITGKVLPMTLEEIQLFAELEDGQIVRGESNIHHVVEKTGSKIKKIFIDPKVSNPLKDGVKAIEEADLIVLGPGSLYTSVIPNLLINNIVDTIYNAKAPKLYILNVMTQLGETKGYDLMDHVNSLLNHTREDLLDYIIANTETIPEDVLEKYITDGSRPVLLKDEDRAILEKKKIKLIVSDLVEIEKGYIRHDSEKLSQLLIDICENKPN